MFTRFLKTPTVGTFQIQIVSQLERMILLADHDMIYFYACHKMSSFIHPSTPSWYSIPRRARAGTQAGTPSQAPTQAVSTQEKGQLAVASCCGCRSCGIPAAVRKTILLLAVLYKSVYMLIQDSKKDLSLSSVC